MTEIEKSKGADLAHFINALGILGVGKKLASDLAKTYGSIDSLMAASKEELMSCPDMGPITAEYITEYFARHKEMITRLKGIGIDPVCSAQTGGVLEGEKVVLTGSLINYKRSEAADIIVRLGGEVLSSVTSKTTLVIAGENAGSKLDKAKKSGIKIIDENDFIALINT